MFRWGETITKKPKLSITTAIVALVIIGVALTLTTYAALSTSSNIPSYGTVTTSANLGVYSNSACTTTPKLNKLGKPNSRKRNNANNLHQKHQQRPFTNLNMTTSNWSPTSANGPITVTWNQQNTDLPPGQSVPATLTLTVSSSISDIYKLQRQIYITGTNP